MNYDEKYEIRLANVNDINEIMSFIDKYWRKNHILASNREYFEYEYVDGNDVHFLLAKEKKSKEIVGILGYIPASKDISRLDIWPVMWKVRDGVLPLLGVELYKRLQLIVGSRSVLGIGNNPNTSVRLLGKIIKNFKNSKMDHYYFLVEGKKYKIAQIIKHKKSNNVKSTLKLNITKLNTIEDVKSFFDLSLISGYPYKDIWYINHRYFNHPIYEYDLFGLKHNEEKALIVIRLQDYADSRIARIVDFIGEQACFSGLYSFINKYLIDNGCEYADFYVSGFNKDYIINSGFIEREVNDVNILPNYFTPFVKQNIDIWVSSNVEGAIFVKADGDQDRPN